MAVKHCTHTDVGTTLLAIDPVRRVEYATVSNVNPTGAYLLFWYEGEIVDLKPIPAAPEEGMAVFTHKCDVTADHISAASDTAGTLAPSPDLLPTVSVLGRPYLR